ncbi:MAG: DNA translocase FtsK [Oscillospiraceae bacterium]|jgi:S-DNA-T family DNA segregation ATPase FtsK/SpoIIIE|nr:DNA translocase FtsK [Oscillospiraceae bacterium]
MPKPNMPGVANTNTQSRDNKNNTGGSKRNAADKNAEKSVDPVRDKQAHALFVLVYWMGFAVACAMMLLRSENAWLILHVGVWGLFGALLPCWLAFAAFVGLFFTRRQPLRPQRLRLGGLVVLLLCVGGVLFLLSHSAQAVRESKWGDLVLNSFDIYSDNGKKLDFSETALNGGLLATLFSAAIAKFFGWAGAMVVYLLFTAVTALLGFPKLRDRLFDRLGNILLGSAGERADEKVNVPVQSFDDDGGDMFAENAERGAEEDDAVVPAATVRRLLAKLGFGSKTDAQAAERRNRRGLETTQPIPPLPEDLDDISIRQRRTQYSWPPELVPAQSFPQPGAREGLAHAVLEDLGDGATKDNAADLARKIAPENAARTKAQQAGEATARAVDALLQDAAVTAPAVYMPPPLTCLSQPRASAAKPDKGEEDMIERKLMRTLESFGVLVEMVGRSRGPAVTRYELRPAEGVKISKITALSDDIALRLAATKVRIEAPIPGKPAVGVEVPNRVRAVVSLRELVESGEYRAGAQKSHLTVALGKDIVGSFVCADLAKLPHLLIAGTTGSGKSVCMNTLILSLLYNASPKQVKLIMVDPKQVEFTVYSSIPHLLVPVVSDPLKAAGALGWAVNEMERRYSQISEQNVRDLDSYNAIAEKREGMETMSKIVIFIDELSDLMMVAPSDVEDSIQRLTQKGRAAGIHLVVATQRPSVDVITGVIKSNLPGRIALSVASQIDSRTIINSAGAEQLLGNGDMLFSLNGGNNAVRVQGCYVSDAEVQRVTRFVREQTQGGAGYDDSVWEEIERNAAMAGSGKKKGGMFAAAEGEEESDDPMLSSAVEVVVDAQMASTTMLQKKLKLGYARASRLVDLLEEKGVVGPPEGSKPRKVLIGKAQWLEIQANGGLSQGADIKNQEEILA